MNDSAGASDVVAHERPGRRAAAIAALAILPFLAVLVVFVIIDNVGLFATLLLAFLVFFAGIWAALSRQEWWRWIGAVVGGVGAIVAFVVALGIGWVSTGAVMAIFLLCAAFAGLTRYALGDRVEVEV